MRGFEPWLITLHFSEYIIFDINQKSQKHFQIMDFEKLRLRVCKCLICERNVALDRPEISQLNIFGRRQAPLPSNAPQKQAATLEQKRKSASLIIQRSS